jgi:hypothetical protein
MTPNTTAGMKTENEIYLEKEAKRALKTQVENTLFSAYLTGKDFERTGRSFDSWNTDNKVSETLIELISKHNQFTPSPPTVLVAAQEKIENRIKELKALGENYTGLSLSVCLQVINELESILMVIEQNNN